ncbi:MAG TPA: hypothetical protein VMZ71_10970, partial [Gemmataceae bacterium]|nr:hypothetical protein [Gemmataceae bacterium]
MFPRRIAAVRLASAASAVSAVAVLVASAGFVSAQSGPQLLTVFPPGVRVGETVEVTVSGTNFAGDEELLFCEQAGKSFKAERVGGAKAPDPKTKQPGGGAAQASAKFKVTHSGPGEKDLGRVALFDVRVVGKNGLSNPRAFAVEGRAQANEAEPNNDVPQAQKVELNTTVSGVISAPTDVDYVSFKAKAGVGVVVSCLTSTIDSRLQADLAVFGPDGKQLAANRGYRGWDALLDFLPSADGEYLVRVSQFAYTTGGADHFYRLTVTTDSWIDATYPPFSHDVTTTYGRNLGKAAWLRERDKKLLTTDPRFTRADGRPFDALVQEWGPPPGFGGGLPYLAVAGPARPALGGMEAESSDIDGNLKFFGGGVLDNEKNGTPETAQVVTLPCDIAGRIAKKNERHWYAFDAKKGDVWTLEVFADRIGSPVDAFFVLTDDKGKVITEADDSPDTLSPNQFYTRSDDPARYRFNVPNDGKYRVMVSTREAGIQWGVRDQYVLRIAKERPDFRLCVMPITPHVPDAVTLQKGGAAMFAVFVFRHDGFEGGITLKTENLPRGVSCETQYIGPRQTRGTLVLTAAKDAPDWAGFVNITGEAKIDGLDRTHDARPFTVTWSPPGLQLNQPPPNTPMLTRMDRCDSYAVALAVRGTAPFSLTPSQTEFKAKPGDKFDVTIKVTRDEKFKDGL